MGNRCYVAFPEAQVAVYLHWNGGLESVLAFLDFMNERGDRGETYGAARFCQIVGNFFGGTLSVGVTGCDGFAAIAGLSDEDNGCFVVGSEPIPGEPFKTRLTVVGWYLKGVDRGDRLAATIQDIRERHAYHQGDADGVTLLDTIREKNAIPADAPKAKVNA